MMYIQGIFYIDEDPSYFRLLHTVVDNSAVLGSEGRVHVLRNGENAGLVSQVISP
jgi:hypothetical protein